MYKKLFFCVLTLLFILTSSFTPILIASAAEDLSLDYSESSTAEAPPPETSPDNTVQSSSAFFPVSASAPEPDSAPSEPAPAESSTTPLTTEVSEHDTNDELSVKYIDVIIIALGIIAGLLMGQAFSFWKW